MKTLGNAFGLGILLLAAAARLPAQVVIGGGGSSITPRNGNTYKGPLEVPAAEPEGPPGAKKPETVIPPPPLIPLAADPVAAPLQALRQPLIGAWGEDLDDWLWWWRFQRWQRLEGSPPPEPGRAVTPVREAARGAAPAAAPPPAPPAADKAAGAERVTALLLEAWHASPGRPEIRAALLLALARCGSGPQVGAVLRAGLNDADLRVVEAAALALGVLREPHGIPHLVLLVGDAPQARALTGRHESAPRTRAFAAYGLGLIAESCSYPSLRGAIAKALLEPLERREEAQVDVGYACATALGLFPGEDAAELAPELLAVLDDGRRPERIRAAAATSLAKLLARAGDSALSRAAYEQLRRRLQSGAEESYVRQSCALALGRLASLPGLAEDAAEVLAEVVRDDRDPRVQHLAAVAMGEIGAGPHLAAQTLALPALLAGLEEGTDQDRAWRAIGLGWSACLASAQGRALPPGVARQLLAQFPERTAPRLRSAASLALGLLGYAGAEPALRRGLEHQGRPELEAEALAALALLGGADALQTVLQRWEDVDPFTEAYQVLCAGLAHHAPDALLAHFQAMIDRSSATYLAHYAASVGLGWLRSEAAIDPLVRLWRDDGNPIAVAVAAVTSLGRVAERPGPRWNAGYLDLLNPYAAPPSLIGDAELPGVCDRW